VAKKDNAERNERRERMERMRREAERAERRRSLVVVVVCVVIALIIGGLTGWKLYRDNQRDEEVASTDVDKLGPSPEAAGCQDVVTKGAEGVGDHRDGQDIAYADSPPAFGPHWSSPADFARKFYTADDRPELQRLVHNLEHGYTLLWYDETVADDSDQLQTVEDIAAKFDVGSPNAIDDYNAGKLLAVPWTSDDGDPFPDGAHVAFTHWAMTGDDAVKDQGEGAWQYCEQPSGEALDAFMEEFPASNAPEPNGA
jgi:Protein of unknown function (DUF3105)